MILKLALRSLAVRPVRTAVLACGFGLGIAVMAALLGVGDVILEQARSPQLQGGGDMVVAGTFGSLENAPFVMSAIRSLRQDSGRPWVVAASPSWRTSLYFIAPEGPTAVVARGGVPSLEKAVGDPEADRVAGWTDSPADKRWSSIAAGDLLRTMDRFHRAPDLPEFAMSWAEWLYFNGRTADGRVRFYVTFLVGPAVPGRPGFHAAGVRLQLDRDGQTTNYSARDEVEERTVVERAPDLDIGGNTVRLDGSRYTISLRLRNEAGGGELTGNMTLDPDEGRSIPPVLIRGARGWLSGYVVPVLSGHLTGSLTTPGTSGTPGAFEGVGYHDHNWGFWHDVRWQWGQVAAGDLSFIYGRVFPPADVADPDRIPGFLGVLKQTGLAGVATNVQIAEEHSERPGEAPNPSAAPDRIVVTGRGGSLDVTLTFSTDRAVRTALAMTGGEMDFLQLGGTYRIQGTAAGRSIDTTARGAAETFRRR